MVIKPEIVYVDDEKMLLKIFKHLFKNDSYHISTFCCPLQALNYLENKKIDLVFSDYQMPKMNGIELANKLSGQPPFYIISTLCPQKISQQSAHIHGVLEKPFNGKRITDIINNHLKIANTTAPPMVA